MGLRFYIGGYSQYIVAAMKIQAWSLGRAHRLVVRAPCVHARANAWSWTGGAGRHVEEERAPSKPTSSLTGPVGAPCVLPHACVCAHLCIEAGSPPCMSVA